MDAIISPSETGYDLNDIKRAVLTYEKVFIAEPGDRDLFPRTGLGMAIGMPPVFSHPGPQPIRPLGKTANYDSQFSQLLADCKPLIDANVLEVTSSWNRDKTDTGQITIGSVPLGGYQLDVRAVLAYYRALARNNDFLTDAIDPSAIELVKNEDIEFLAPKGQADGSFNDDPPLPLMDGQFEFENLREPLTILARSRIGTAIKYWGVAGERNQVPVLPVPLSTLMDRLAMTIRGAIDATESDPYWARRTAILVMTVCEFISDDTLNSIPTVDLLKFRTSAMKKSIKERSQLFADVREMAGDMTNLDLAGFKSRIQDRMQLYENKVSEVKEERKKLGWQLALGAGKTASYSAASMVAAGGIFHISLPVSLSAALFTSVAWGLGKTQESLPAIIKILENEREIKGSNEFAVFRQMEYLKKLK